MSKPVKPGQIWTHPRLYGKDRVKILRVEYMYSWAVYGGRTCEGLYLNNTGLPTDPKWQLVDDEPQQGEPTLSRKVEIGQTWSHPTLTQGKTITHLKFTDGRWCGFYGDRIGEMVILDNNWEPCSYDWKRIS